MLTLFGLAFIAQACSTSTTKAPAPAIPGQSTRLPSPSHVSAEQQLLQTVKHAESLGKGNPLVLSSLYSLADYYRSQRQFDKAEEQYQKALRLKEELSGPNHPDIVTILKNYASLLREAQRYAEAENLTSRASAILAKSSPPLPAKSGRSR